MQYAFSRGGLLIALALLSACDRHRADEALRVDAADVMAIPRVWAEPDELLYLDALRRAGSDSTYIKISALVHRSQVAALRPCALVALQQHGVLLKTGNCAPDAATLLRIDRYVRRHQLDDSALRYRVDANGDSVILNKLVNYDPETVYITVYQNVVVKVDYSPY